MDTNYYQHTTCVSSDSDSISEMQALAGLGHNCESDLSFKTAKDLLGNDFWRDYADTATFFKNDPYINMHQSAYQGFPCVFIKASGIEHVYIDSNGPVMLDNGYASEFIAFDNHERVARLDTLAALSEKSELWEDALAVLCQKLSQIQLRSLKKDNFHKTFARVINLYPEDLNAIIQTYNQMADAATEQIKSLRILPSSILEYSRGLPLQHHDMASTLMGLINKFGPEFGLDLTYTAATQSHEFNSETEPAVGHEPSQPEPDSHKNRLRL